MEWIILRAALAQGLGCHFLATEFVCISQVDERMADLRIRYVSVSWSVGLLDQNKTCGQLTSSSTAVDERLGAGIQVLFQDLPPISLPLFHFIVKKVLIRNGISSFRVSNGPIPRSLITRILSVNPRTVCKLGNPSNCPWRSHSRGRSHGR